MEIIRGLVDPLVKNHAHLDFGDERVLHVAQEVLGAWESKGHGAEFAKNLVPLLDAGPLLGSGDAGQYFGQALHAVKKGGGRMGLCVDDPTKDELDCAL